MTENGPLARLASAWSGDMGTDQSMCGSISDDTSWLYTRRVHIASSPSSNLTFLRRRSALKPAYKLSIRSPAAMAMAAATGARCLLPVPSLRSSKARISNATSVKVKLPVAAPVAKFDLREPPYPLDALEPHMSKQTLEFHWGKHHRAYVTNLNAQIENSDLERNSLDEIVKISYNNGNPTPQFNNAGQIWNHDFFWESMKPGGGGPATGEIADLINRDFGSYENFVKEFKAAGATQFGSGWAWLVLKKGKLAIEKTPNAVTPILWDSIPLLVVDVWEHAYYLDFQNRRPDYLSTYVDQLISWEAVNERLERAKASVNLGTPSIPEL